MKLILVLAVTAGCGTPRLPGDTAWVTPLLPGTFGSQLAAIDGDVVTFTGPGEGPPTGLVRIGGADGNQVWVAQLAQPAGNYDHLVVADGWIVHVRGEMADVALDRYDATGAFRGTTQWTGLPTMNGCLFTLVVAASANTIAIATCSAYQQGSPTDASPPVHALAMSPSVMAATNDRIAIGGSDVELVDATGERAITGDPASALAFTENGDLVVAFASGVARIAPSGAVLWTVPVAISVGPALVAIAASGDVLFGGGAFYAADDPDNQGRVAALAADSGAIVADDSIYGTVIALVGSMPAVALVEDPATALVALELR